MSSLTFILTLVAAIPKCEGGVAEVPFRLTGWATDQTKWVESELSEWFSAHDRKLCAAREVELTCLTIALAELEVIVRFDFGGELRTRTLPRAADSALSDLFRYQVAATAEELARASWETLSSSRLGLFAHAAVSPLANGLTFVGGGLGARLFFIPSLSAELRATAESSLSSDLPDGAALTGVLVSGTVALSWLPLRFSIFRAGPRASVQGGVLLLTVAPNDGSTASGAAPWLSVFGGASIGVETRHFTLMLFGEGGTIVVGAEVFADNASVRTVRGARGCFGVQAGLQW